MNVQVESTIRGVSYEEPRDRWRCFHRRLGKPTLQLRFDNQYDAVWKKIELCADDVPIEIHVNPSNAAESIVVKNIIWEHMSKLLVGFIISWAVFLWLVYVLVFKLKHKK